jgi:hypothetical protein
MSVVIGVFLAGARGGGLAAEEVEQGAFRLVGHGELAAAKSVDRTRLADSLVHE